MAKLRTPDLIEYPLGDYPFVTPRAPGQYDARKVSDETGLDCSVEPSLTQQQFKYDGDVNFIMDKFLRTNDLSLFQQSAPQYGDFTGVNDLHTALNIVAAAEEAFSALPARIRSRFDNDPLQFAQFLDDDKNFDEALQLGLLRPDAKSMKDAPLPPAEEGPAGAGPLGQQTGGAGGGKGA